MIPERFVHKTKAIQEVIETRITDFKRVYRSGPDLYFYRRVVCLNKKTNTLKDFISNEYNLEIIYATLVAWDMNSRGAKLKYFNEFKENILSLSSEIEKLWRKKLIDVTDFDSILHILSNIYDKLHVMKTGGRLVSNSKLLHFIFPELLMPMDRRNTLMYFYGHTNESKKQYLELIEWSRHFVENAHIDWDKYLDTEWNVTIPKILDNAIIVKHNKSVKNR